MAGSRGRSLSGMISQISSCSAVVWYRFEFDLCHSLTSKCKEIQLIHVLEAFPLPMLCADIFPWREALALKGPDGAALCEAAADRPYAWAEHKWVHCNC